MAAGEKTQHLSGNVTSRVTHGAQIKNTPLRRQYLDIKRRFPNELLLFRLGDFYETFDQDAHSLSEALNIVLTSREIGKGQRVPMAGIPYHALESYLSRLLDKGYRVAICEQTGDPAASDGLVERDVVRVVTAGTIVEPNMLQSNTNNYLAVVITEGDQAGIAYTDISTSTFETTQLGIDLLFTELDRIAPAEIVVPVGQDFQYMANLSTVDSISLELPEARQKILDHFQTSSLEPFGCQDLPLATQAAAGVLNYLEGTQKEALVNLSRLRTYSTGHFMPIDRQTRRSLELFQGGRFGDGLTLLNTLDHTETPMGGRLLREWLGQPLLDTYEIGKRHDMVEWIVSNPRKKQAITKILKTTADVERILNRIRRRIVSPRELVALRRTLETVPSLMTIFSENSNASDWLRSDLHSCTNTVQLISSAIEEEPPARVGDGNTIRYGYSKDLDDIRQTSRDAREYLVKLESQERNQSGIPSLKVGYNRVFGYYIEVTNPNLSRVPTKYIRRQTLVNAERYITPELKDYEIAILNARDRMELLETSLFEEVCIRLSEDSLILSETAKAIARVDALTSLAHAAFINGYTRPIVDNSNLLRVRDGRHPIVENSLGKGSFIPNSIELSDQTVSLMLLTGPNMSGKSTFIRQVALIVLMTQIGSFVPAAAAHIGLVDRIFTRIGLQDDLSVGQSTFMVEMTETAAILNQATSRSLLILDEIGRGTSTYDGLVIAHAVVEYIHSHPRLGCRTLFATHYHELTELARCLPHAENYSVSVLENAGEIVFLHQIVPGGTDRSYGIHVAKIAGLPNPIITRARDLLAPLEKQNPTTKKEPVREQLREHSGQTQERHPMQLGLFQSSSNGLVDELNLLDISTMTPLDALNKLYEFQKLSKSLGQQE
jgi:DNA mismatch repair protein MutS